jgi:hypothetical protein
MANVERLGTGWRVTAGVMGVVLMGFAALQLNDPDPEVWGTLYGAVALLSFAAAAGRPFPVVAAVFAVGTLAWAVPLLLQVRHTSPAALFDFFSMKTLATEEAREGFGLLIVAVWMAALWWSTRKRTPETRAS